MQVMVSAAVISGILNCVCPDCGGSMGGAGEEFKCQGECQTDWRPLWEQLASAEFHPPSRKRSH
jgi:tRNA(Ile2) C34 agmatinyltransferase TiaS